MRAACFGKRTNHQGPLSTCHILDDVEQEPPAWHAFRIRFRTALTFPICPEADEFLLDEDDSEVVWIRSVGGGPIGETEWLTVRGSRYPSVESAVAASERWRDRIERAFAALHVPADFGERKAFSSWTSPEVLNRRSEFLGARVMNEVHGVTVFPDGESVYFLSASGSGYAPRSAGSLRYALVVPSNRREYPHQRLAFDLFNHGVLAKSPDAKFVLLMMAVEALMTTFDRSDRVHRVVEDLRAVLLKADLDAAERDALLSHVGQAKRASFRQQGERLAESLGERRYGAMSPAAFFTHCYKLRGRLVHGDADRPAQGELTRLGAHLRRFVGDLIAGPELVRDIAAQDDDWSRASSRTCHSATSRTGGSSAVSVVRSTSWPRTSPTPCGARPR